MALRQHERRLRRRRNLTAQSQEFGRQLEGLLSEKTRLAARQKNWSRVEAARRDDADGDHLRMGRIASRDRANQRSHAEVARAKNESDSHISADVHERSERAAGRLDWERDGVHAPRAGAGERTIAK